MQLNVLKLDGVIAIFIVVITSFVSPVFFELYKGYVGLATFILTFILLIGLTTGGKKIIRKTCTLPKYNKGLFFSLIWFIIGIFLAYLRGGDDIGFVIFVILLVVYYLVGEYISLHKKYRQFAIFATFSFLILNIIISGQAIGQGLSARELYQESSNSSAGTSGFWGLIGIFLPIFIGRVTEQESLKIKVFYLVGSLYLFYKLIFSGFTTPNGLFLIGLFTTAIFYMYFRVKRVSTFFRAIIISSLFLLLAYYLFNFFLTSNIEAINAIQYRLKNFINNPLSGGYGPGSNAISRFYLMGFSWETFINNPLIGGGGDMRTYLSEGIAGGHSSLFDSLAVLGLIGGGGALINLVILSIKNLYQKMKTKRTFYSICEFSSAISFFVGGIMNPYWSGAIIATFLLITSIYREY